MICVPEAGVYVEDAIEELENEAMEAAAGDEPAEIVEPVEDGERESRASDTDNEPLEDPRQRRRVALLFQTADAANKTGRYVMVHVG